jgi:hypothetical protein
LKISICTHRFNNSLGTPGGLSESAELASEATLLWLVEAVAARATESSFRVVELSGGATLLAVGGRPCARSRSDSGTSGDGWALNALQLSGLALVGASGTGDALLALAFVVRANSTRN